MMAAMRLLSRREYSDKELRLRLRNRNFTFEDIESVLEELIGCGYLSNQRFAESYARSRCSQGYGPQRIEMELAERGVSEADQQHAMCDLDVDWFDKAQAVRIKKFGLELPIEVRDRAKQWRFLQYRGFASEHIVYAMKTLLEEV